MKCLFSFLSRQPQIQEQIKQIGIFLENTLQIYLALALSNGGETPVHSLPPPADLRCSRLRNPSSRSKSSQNLLVVGNLSKSISSLHLATAAKIRCNLFHPCHNSGAVACKTQLVISSQNLLIVGCQRKQLVISGCVSRFIF